MISDPTVRDAIAPHRDRIRQLVREWPGHIEGMSIVILTPTEGDADLLAHAGHAGKIVALVPAHVVREMIAKLPPETDRDEMDAKVVEIVDALKVPIFVTLDGFVGVAALRPVHMNAPGGVA